MDILKNKYSKRFDVFLLQTTSEILGKLKMLIAGAVTPETLDQYNMCLAQAKLLGSFSIEVEIKGGPAENKRQETHRLLKEIVELANQEDNPFLLINNPTQAKDLPSMLRAMSARGSFLFQPV
jgi:hypothetical protein